MTDKTLQDQWLERAAAMMHTAKGYNCRSTEGRRHAMVTGAALLRECAKELTEHEELAQGARVPEADGKAVAKAKGKNPNP